MMKKNVIKEQSIFRSIFFNMLIPILIGSLAGFSIAFKSPYVFIFFPILVIYLGKQLYMMRIGKKEIRILTEKIKRFEGSDEWFATPEGKQHEDDIYGPDEDLHQFDIEDMPHATCNGTCGLYLPQTSYSFKINGTEDDEGAETICKDCE